VHLALDGNHPQFHEYLYCLPHGVTVHRNNEPRSVPALLEWLAGEARGEILLVGSDDILFRTRRWDELTEAQFQSVPDGILAVAFNDLSGSNKWTHFAVSRAWFETVGHLTYANFEHFGADEYVERIAKAAGRGLWLKDVVLEHMHKKYRVNGRPKAENDATYDAKRKAAPDGSSMSSRDTALLNNLQPRMMELAHHIKTVVQQKAA